LARFSSPLGTPRTASRSESAPNETRASSRRGWQTRARWTRSSGCSSSVCLAPGKRRRRPSPASIRTGSSRPGCSRRWVTISRQRFALCRRRMSWSPTTPAPARPRGLTSSRASPFACTSSRPSRRSPERGCTRSSPHGTPTGRSPSRRTPVRYPWSASEPYSTGSTISRRSRAKGSSLSPDTPTAWSWRIRHASFAPTRTNAPTHAAASSWRPSRPGSARAALRTCSWRGFSGRASAGGRHLSTGSRTPGATRSSCSKASTIPPGTRACTPRTRLCRSGSASSAISPPTASPRARSSSGVARAERTGSATRFFLTPTSDPRATSSSERSWTRISLRHSQPMISFSRRSWPSWSRSASSRSGGTRMKGSSSRAPAHVSSGALASRSESMRTRSSCLPASMAAEGSGSSSPRSRETRKWMRTHSPVPDFRPFAVSL